MKSLAFILCAIGLAGCGGGGGSTPAEPAALSLSGTAATGRAIAGASVKAKCLGGTGETITLSDGAYSLSVTGGKLPCLLEVTDPSDGTKLHTVAIGTGNAALVNLTPLTEMLVARVLRADPGTLYDAFDAAKVAGAFTPLSLTTAQIDIGLALLGTVDLAALKDMVGTGLKAATAAAPAQGDAQDKLLDALRAHITPAQLKLLIAALANGASPADIKHLITTFTGLPPSPGG